MEKLKDLLGKFILARQARAFWKEDNGDWGDFYRDRAYGEAWLNLFRTAEIELDNARSKSEVMAILAIVEEAGIAGDYSTLATPRRASTFRGSALRRAAALQ